MDPTSKPSTRWTRAALLVACALIIGTYALMMDRKSISTDEGFRLWIINGGQPFTPGENLAQATWARVLEAISPHAYQPLYFLLQNTLMRITGLQGLDFFRSVNLAFLGLCLWGLLALSRGWRLGPRLFLLGLFSGNAYLFMHVLQIREYIAGVAFYIWSTWLVLALDRRTLGRPWPDVAWFASYGVLLTLGFYLQSWVVFPAIGQFLFLLPRRPGQRLRFYTHLAVSYLLVLATTWPYLLTHRQKVNVGLWASEAASLQSHLSTGFHLLLTGHVEGHARFTDFLFWFWPAVLAGSALLLYRRKFSQRAPELARACRHQGRLMLLCMVVSLGFQVGYFYKVENLSMWPRYFVIHYFFLTWLIALSFRYLYELRTAGAPTAWERRGFTVAAGLLTAVLAVSGCYQTRSFYQDPYLDTGENAVSNWANLGAGLFRVARPGDVVIMPDFITRSTLTATWPLPIPVLMLAELEASGRPAYDRVIYVELAGREAQSPGMTQHLSDLGFAFRERQAMSTPDGRTVIPDWHLLIYQRR